jgi:IS30 family transposase
MQTVNLCDRSACYLGRSASTVQREIRRNSSATKVWQGGYDPVRAHDLAWRRRRWDKRFKLARQPDLRDLVRDRLAMGMSPEQIAGRLALEHGRTVISHESIYRYVYHRSTNKDYWHRLLPRRKSRRGYLGTRGGNLARLIRHRRPIADRPREATDRTTPGHWEADYMLFAKPGQSILVLHERHSRYIFAVHPPDRRAATTAEQIRKLLAPIPKDLARTLTIDNGPEFALHYQTGIDTFFCDTHAPWQKGGIENAIGRLRRSLPRKTILQNHQPDPVAQAIYAYNHTPRKCLDFKTPNEAFSQIHSTVALQT